MYISINGVDLSEHIQKQEYSVNAEKINHTEWQDANGKYHECKLRTRVTGSIGLAFYKPDDYQNFLNALAIATDSEDVLTITVFISNMNKTEEIKVYYTLTSAGHLDYDLLSGAAIDKVTLEIREQ